MRKIVVSAAAAVVVAGVGVLAASPASAAPKPVTVDGPALVWEQQVGVPAGGCESIVDPALDGFSGAGGWGQSWAQWMNDGKGGAVCTRSIVWGHEQLQVYLAF